MVQREEGARQWVLQARDLTKRYGPGCAYCSALTGAEQSNRCPVCGTVTACANINFTVEQGEVLGIVGESGSGKSTLMQIVNLSLPPDNGELWYRELNREVSASSAPVNLLQLDKISRAISSNPSVLLLDEVTSGLDLSVQARVLDLIRHIQWELKMTMLLVSHDLGVIKQLAGRTLVMRNGWVVESGLTDQILEDLQHPYTQLLVSSAL